MKLVAFISSLAGVAGSSVESAFLTEAALRGWNVGAEVGDDRSIELTFAVKQQNLDKLLETFHAVSDPKNDAYGQHLSFEQVNELTAPHPEALAAVETAVQSLGATEIRRTPNGDFVVAEVTVAAAERAFGGNFLQFVHEDGRRAVRNPQATLPDALRAAVDFVMPLNQMISSGGPLKLEKTAEEDLEVEAGGLVNTPASLRELYNLVNESGGTAGNKQAFTGFLEQYWTNVDLQEFNTAYNSEGKGEKPARQIGDGKSSGLRVAGVEAELDAQYIMAMGLHVETEFWSFAGRSPDNDQNEPFLKWMTTLGNISDAPLIISTSYGEDEDSMTLDYQTRCNVEFQKAGVRGISLFFASGDSGVGGAVKCSDQCSGYAQGEKCFQAMWPSASPYVTAVGGTKGAKEKGAGLSSGGFSYRWAMPDWQKDAVATFLAKEGQPDTSLYTTTGRGYPDISAKAVNYMVIALAVPLPVSGTSAASPTAAGIFSLVNDRRLAAGQSPLGFVNPLLYANAGALNDIVGGHNPGCGSTGFTAVEGWDPVTGLGSPNFKALAALPAGNKATVVV
jgi:tripeptidyl-peptidase-1